MTRGEVVSIDAEGCRGWATIAELPEYALTIHLVLDDRIQASTIADREAEASDHPSACDSCGFHINVPAAAAGRIADCRILVGESHEYLDDAARRGVTKHPASAHAPTSYRDALNLGLGAADVIELLYLDILRRSVDKDSLDAKLAELKSGRGSYESFRRALLDSNEYRGLSLRVREAPGRTFARPVAYASSTRRLAMERHAAAFQRHQASLRSKLLDFLPGLVAVPGAADALQALADKGVPEREVFFRALAILSRRPSLIAADRREAARSYDDAGAAGGDLEVAFSCASSLFVHGWNRLERSPDLLFRWMEQVGIILNPRPESRIERFEVRVESWYGDLDRRIAGIADGTELSCERHESGDRGAILSFAPCDGVPLAARRIALVAADAACPWRRDGTADMRLISCQVSTARFQYEGEVG